MTTPAQDLLSWSITALQLAANMSTAAAQVSNMLAKMAAEGRDTPTPAELRVYLAICSLHDSDGVVTLRGIMAIVGNLSLGWVHQIAYRLRALGWITFTDGDCATIRPLRRVELFPEALRKAGAT